MVRAERGDREGIVMDRYYVVVDGERDIRKSGDPAAPSMGLYGIVGRGHVREGEGGEERLAKSEGPLALLAALLGMEGEGWFKD